MTHVTREYARWRTMMEAKKKKASKTTSKKLEKKNVEVKATLILEMMADAVSQSFKNRDKEKIE